jgi:hypothetical protein
MPENCGTVQQPVFSRRLTKILSLMERFREEAERKGNRCFAGALHQCTQNISGGNVNCPLGKLVVEESARTGNSLASRLLPQLSRYGDPTSEAGQASMTDAGLSATKALEWRSKYNTLWALLMEDARLTGDEECLRALEACNDLTQAHRCPVRELILQGLWHGGNS